jgi:hypothetical protein
MIFNEVNTGIYAWDILDEGMDRILDTLQEDVGITALYITGLMHAEKRPHKDITYKHNPARKYFVPNDARAYWKPNPAAYAKSRIKPRVIETEGLAGTDWVKAMTDACRKRGIKTGVSMSHTPLDKERAQGEFSDCVQRDVFGNALSPVQLGKANKYHSQLLCWNNPDALDYIEALVTDHATNQDVDYIQISNFLFFEGRPDLHPVLGAALGGCFCESCQREARARGYDWDAIVKTVRGMAEIVQRGTVKDDEAWLLLKRGDSSPIKLLIENPPLYEWMQFRCESVNRYFERVSTAIKGARKTVDFRYNTCFNPDYIGQNLADIGKYVDSIRIMDYSEETGSEEKVRGKVAWLSNVRREVGPDMPIVDSIAARAHATPELIKLGIKTIALNGSDGLSFGFYDGASREMMRAIGEGIREAEIEVQPKHFLRDDPARAKAAA